MRFHLQAPGTKEQAIGLEVSRMVASLLSLLGATFIIQHVIRGTNSKHGLRQSSFKRIILMMSVMDWIFAVVSSCSSIIAPKEVDWLIHFARGTWGTCEAFGFIGKGSSLASIGYNGSLTLHYLLTIRYGWTERALCKVEWWLHGIPLIYGWIVAIVALPLNYYNPGASGCNLAPYPFGCTTRGNCERGEHAFVYRLAFVFGYLWIIFAFSVIAMILIYTAIVKVDNQQINHNEINAVRYIQQHSSSVLQHSSNQLQSQQQPMTTSITNNNILEPRKEGSSSIINFRNGTVEESLSSTSSPTRLHRLRKQFAIQALLYCTAFFFTYIFSSVGVILVQWTDVPIYMPIVFLSTILESLQGFWNAFIYIRPRIVRWWYNNNNKRRKQQQQELQLTPQEQQQHHEQEEQPPFDEQEKESSSSHEQRQEEM